MDLSEDDVNRIRKESRRWRWIIAIGGLIAVLLMFLIGFLIGFFISNGDTSSNGYPYATSAFGVASLKGRIRKRFLMPFLFILGFLIGSSTPVFGNGVRYGVFGREGIR